MPTEKLIKVSYGYCIKCRWETIDNRLIYCRKCHGDLVAHYGLPKKLRLTNEERKRQNKTVEYNFNRDSRKYKLPFGFGGKKLVYSK